MTRQHLRQLTPDLLAFGGLLALTLAVYLPYATEAGWFLDDWSLYSEERAVAGSFWDRMTYCMDSIPGGRKAACFYHVTEWSLLGNHRWAYHLVSIAFLVAIAALVYAIARRGRLGRVWCFAIAAAVIVFPGADSARLWAVASIGQYVIALQLTSLLLAIMALARPPGRRSWALHAGAALIALLAMATYEIVVPLIALQGLVYIAIYRNRQAFLRWGLDLLLVLVFLFYRLVLFPVESTTFVAERTTGQMLERVRLLLEGAWDSWSTLFVPGLLLPILLAIIAVAAVASLASPALRPRLLPWWLLLAGGTVAAGACALAYLTAEDAYIPVIGSTYNRVNLAGTVPYAVAFVAVLGLLYELVRRWSPWAYLAPLAVAVVALFSVQHQLDVSAGHKREWLNSWELQEEAIPGFQRAMEGVPPGARVLGFDVPQWEGFWVPVVAQSWGLRGLLAYETPVFPSYASPFHEGLVCAKRGVAEAAGVVAPYADRSSPVFFASPARGVAIRVDSRRECRRLLRAWGRAPLFPPAPS